MKPKMLTKTELKNWSRSDILNHYRLANIYNWSEMLGNNWFELDWNERYKNHINWYNKTYTKLGQALK